MCFPVTQFFSNLFNLGSLMFFFGPVKNHESFTDPALTWNCSQELSASSSWLRKGAEDRQISRLKIVADGLGDFFFPCLVLV